MPANPQHTFFCLRYNHGVVYTGGDIKECNVGANVCIDKYSGVAG
jgi:hypothetical protein